MSNSHFYNPVTGQLIDGGLREARKVNGLPSPTTVLQMLRGPGLIQYFRRQMFEAAYSTPRQPQWTDDEHFAACLNWAEEHGKSARDKGGDFHNLIQQFHLSLVGAKPPPMVPPEVALQYDGYLQWYEKWVAKTLLVEEVVIGQGYAGRLDHCCVLKDGRIALVDVKTQDTSKRNGRFNHYTEWALQLAAYAGAMPEQGRPELLISVCVSTNRPFTLEAYCWPGAVAYYHLLFLSLLEIWKMEHNYWPTGLLGIMDEKQIVTALEAQKNPS